VACVDRRCLWERVLVKHRGRKRNVPPETFVSARTRLAAYPIEV